MDVGLPIWITEMDFFTKDRSKMADWYETAYRLYFSHPSVEGILTWGFWNEDHWRPDAAFVEGDGFTVNVIKFSFSNDMFKKTNTNV